MYAQQDKNRSGSPESSGLPLDSVLGAVPPEGLPGRQGPGNIQDTLVGTATETEADVLLLQKKGAVHQHIQLMKKFPVQRTHPAGGQLLVEVAGVAPDIPAGELLPHPAYQGEHLRLIRRGHGLAPQQGQPADIAGAEQIQDGADLFLPESLAILEIPGLRIEAAGAAMGAAGHKEGDPDARSVGHVNGADVGVVHKNLLLICISAPQGRDTSYIFIGAAPGT